MSNGSKPSHDLESIQRRLGEWSRSFVPAETTIDGGLFPTRIGDGMLGFEYGDFRLSDRPHERTPLTPELACEFETLFGGPPSRSSF